jgi:hypothetical protein
MKILPKLAVAAVFLFSVQAEVAAVEKPNIDMSDPENLAVLQVLSEGQKCEFGNIAEWREVFSRSPKLKLITDQLSMSKAAKIADNRRVEPGDEKIAISRYVKGFENCRKKFLNAKARGPAPAAKLKRLQWIMKSHWRDEDKLWTGYLNSKLTVGEFLRKQAKLMTVMKMQFAAVMVTTNNRPHSVTAAPPANDRPRAEKYANNVSSTPVSETRNVRPKLATPEAKLKTSEAKAFFEDIQYCLEINEVQYEGSPDQSTHVQWGKLILDMRQKGRAAAMWLAFQDIESIDESFFDRTLWTVSSNIAQTFIREKLRDIRNCYHRAVEIAGTRPNTGIITRQLSTWAKTVPEEMARRAEPFINGEITLGEYLRKKRADKVNNVAGRRLSEALRSSQ